MSYQNIPVKKYFVASEDEDYLAAENETSFEETNELLNQIREINRHKVWAMFAEINA